MALVVHLMGAVRLVSDGQRVDVGGPKQRAVLAVLALSAGRRVSTDRLVDLVWDEHPPASARRTVQSYVASLRRAMGAGAALKPAQNGYTLEIDRVQVDLLAFEDRSAELFADVGLDPDVKADALEALLSAWEPPLDGLRDVPRLMELAAPFDELRLQAVEALAAAQIAGTRSGDAVKMLEALVREYPTRENFWLELARGLNRLGRRDAALTAMQRARESLREHLGVHPSALLATFETDLLTDDGERLQRGGSDGVDPPLDASPAPLEPAGRPGGLSPTGNLPRQSTSFVGRGADVRMMSQLIREHQLVTVTGVGGVGKTRLAVQVATDLEPEFDDGVWFVELAPVGNAASVPNATATALGLRAQPGKSMTATIAETLAGRRMLVVLDSCEHVLDAAADLVEAITGCSETVSVVATSREGLGIGGEHLWAVPPFDLTDGASSAAAELFMERADAVVAGFSLELDTDREAVAEICRRLDGIPLGIELAAARMLSMTPSEVLARLSDGFHLVSGSRRGPQRHQTMSNVVQWSYDLLTADEKAVLHACAVFAGGFDVSAVTAACDRFDEYTMLDVLDSLVRKSLVTTSRAGGRTRFGMLETVRQFSEEQHVGSTDAEIGEIRDRHAQYFAAQAAAQWELWDGPQQRDATDWVEAEFDNLRTGFFWAIDREDLSSAVAIAAHTTALAYTLQRYEPVEWAEAVLPAAAAADLAQLPRLYSAASLCSFVGRSADAVRYAEAASALQTDPHYQPFDVGWVRHAEALAHLLAGRTDRYLEICTELIDEPGLGHVVGLCGRTHILGLVGRDEEGIEIADDAMAAARAHGNPFWIAAAHAAGGAAFAAPDPVRALDILRRGLSYARNQRSSHTEALIAAQAASLEAAHGDIDQALILFASAVDSFYRAGDTVNLRAAFGSVAWFFAWVEMPEVAATLCGATMDDPLSSQTAIGTAVVAQLRDALDTDTFDDRVRIGAAMNLTEVVHYAQHHINAARQLET